MKKERVKLSKKTFVTLFILIIILALFMRFYNLDSKPLHFDEGNHWHSFVNKIYEGESFTYLPDFHGFTPWYLSTLPLYIFGLSIFSLRFMVAFLGAALIAILYPLRRYVGDIGLLVSALFLAVSPTMVYYSRHLSQYPHFIFFLTLSFIFVVYYLEKYKKIFLYLFAISLGLLVTTHEISIIFIAITLFFLAFIYYLNRSNKKFKVRMKHIDKQINTKTLYITFFIFLSVIIIIMSSFLTNFNNLFGFLGQSTFQLEKSYSTGHNKPFYYYAITFLPIELFIFLGSLLIFAFKRKSFDYFYLFVAFWTIISFLIFSIIPYKIPWIFIIVLTPMFLLSGLNISTIFERIKSKKILSIIVILLVILFTFSLYTSIKLNYIDHTNKNNPLNYVGPTDDVYQMHDDLYSYLNSDSKILISSKSYWPLPFYLRDYNVSYLNNIITLNITDYPEYDIYIIDSSQNNDELSGFQKKQYEVWKNRYMVILFRNKTINL